MSILVDARTRVVIQGITGRQGRYHTRMMLDYGVQVTAGVSPGKGGQTVHGVPVFHTVAAAGRSVGVDAAMILVPPAGVREAALEAIDNAVPLLVIVTEFVPFHDSLVIHAAAVKQGIRVIGPNTIGVISPGQSKVGVMPGFIYRPGRVGIISRSGTLTHEVASNLSHLGIGQSTCTCIGGDLVKSTDFTDVLDLFGTDADTDAVIMIGEIGGVGEEQAARYIRESHYPKSVFAFIAGANSPPDTRMGHAGAIVSQAYGSAASKREALQAAGVTVVDRLDDIYRCLTPA